MGIRILPIERLPKIGFIGLPKSGKGFATEVLLTHKKFIGVTLSDVIRSFAKQNEITLRSRNDFKILGDKLEKKFGQDYMLNQSIEMLQSKLDESKDEIHGLIFEGMRRLNVVKGFKELPNSLLIMIDASPEIRFSRQREHRPEDNAATFEDFMRNETEEEKVMKEISRLADLTISNESTKEEFEKCILDIVNNLLIK